MDSHHLFEKLEDVEIKTTLEEDMLQFQLAKNKEIFREIKQLDMKKQISGRAASADFRWQIPLSY